MPVGWATRLSCSCAPLSRDVGGVPIHVGSVLMNEPLPPASTQLADAAEPLSRPIWQLHRRTAPLVAGAMFRNAELPPSPEFRHRTLVIDRSNAAAAELTML